MQLRLSQQQRWTRAAVRLEAVLEGLSTRGRLTQRCWQWFHTRAAGWQKLLAKGGEETTDKLSDTQVRIAKKHESATRTGILVVTSCGYMKPNDTRIRKVNVSSTRRPPVLTTKEPRSVNGAVEPG